MMDFTKYPSLRWRSQNSSAKFLPTEVSGDISIQLDCDRTSKDVEVVWHGMARRAPAAARHGLVRREVAAARCGLARRAAAAARCGLVRRAHAAADESRERQRRHWFRV
jgi:hypothetical protein